MTDAMFVACPAAGQGMRYHQIHYWGLDCSFVPGEDGPDVVAVEAYLAFLNRRIDRLESDLENQAMGDDL